MRKAKYIQSKETGLGRVAAEDTTVTDGLIATSVVKRTQHGSVRGRTNTRQQPFNTRLWCP